MNKISTTTIDGYILTGGASSRMGRDKATILIDGLTMVDRIATNLRQAVRQVYTVGGVQVAGLESVPDWKADASGVEQTVKSALTGLVTALRHARSEWIFVVACDMPFATIELFQLLATAAGQGKSAIVPTDIDGRLQPTCSLYRVEDCLAKAEAALAKERHSLRELLAEIEVQFVPFETLVGLSGSARLFINVNTPEDLAGAEQLMLVPNSKRP